jgi:hypothetical protein
VKTTGCRVRPGAKLATGVKLGENYLHTRKARLWLNIDWDSTAVIFNGDASVFVEFNGDFLSVPCQSLVNAIVDDLPEAVH